MCSALTITVSKTSCCFNASIPTLQKNKDEIFIRLCVLNSMSEWGTRSNRSVNEETAEKAAAMIVLSSIYLQVVGFAEHLAAICRFSLIFNKSSSCPDIKTTRHICVPQYFIYSAPIRTHSCSILGPGSCSKSLSLSLSHSSWWMELRTETAHKNVSFPGDASLAR